MKQQYINFDVQAYLDSRGIRWWPPGSKNVGKGWVGLTCVFHNDHSNHLGVSLSRKVFKCLSCGRKGFIVELVQRLEGNCSHEQARAVIQRFQGAPRRPPAQARTPRRKGNILPAGARAEFSDMHLAYLRSRRFDPGQIIRKYGLLCCGPVGLYKFRIIIPVFYNGQVVNFTARDVTGKSDKKYRNCPNDKVIMPVEKILYNLDNVRGRNVVLMEGATDVWRIGDNSIASLGMTFNYERALLLHDRGVRNCYVMFDAGADAAKRAAEAASVLTGIMDRVEIVELVEGDPAKFTDGQVELTRRELEL